MWALQSFHPSSKIAQVKTCRPVYWNNFAWYEIVSCLFPLYLALRDMFLCLGSGFHEDFARLYQQQWSWHWRVRAHSSRLLKRYLNARWAQRTLRLRSWRHVALTSKRRCRSSMSRWARKAPKFIALQGKWKFGKVTGRKHRPLHCRKHWYL